VEYAEKGSSKEDPQYVSITIIDTKYMTRDSLNRVATDKYVDDNHLLNTFFIYMNIERSNGSNKYLL
jgi:hypothetical protein